MSRSLAALLALVACSPDPSTGAPTTSTSVLPTGPTAPTAPTEPPEPSEPVPTCAPPARQVLAEIPELDLPDLRGDYVAVFEVDGDQLIGRSARDAEVAEGALRLWQELVMRIPLNQRTQLVQLTMVENDELAAWVDNVGTGNDVGRYGPSLYLNVDLLTDDDPDVCAPLSGRRGTFDWTLIHEFGHLRQYADGTVDDFVEAFGTPTGDGEGYPEDGTPVVDGDFVTSYAERAGGDEDAAESWTTYVMLADLPTADTVAADKVRFFDEVPGYRELRQALRITEPGGGATAVPDAPLRSFDLEIANPEWLIGTWRGAGPEGTVEYVITADDLWFTASIEDGAPPLRYSELRAGGALATIRVVESSEAFHLLQVAVGDEGWSETFSLSGASVSVVREHFGAFSVALID